MGIRVMERVRVRVRGGTAQHANPCHISVIKKRTKNGPNCMIVQSDTEDLFEFEQWPRYTQKVLRQPVEDEGG